ncbi:MAG: cupin domain-containing protein, partial [Pseudomonadota bacterium]
MDHGYPSQELLASYAAGGTSEGISLAIAAHLTYCPESRERLAEIEAVAGAMLAEADADEAPSLDAIMARLDDEEVAAPSPEIEAGPLPAPVAQAIGMDFDQIPWKFRLPGVHEYEFLNDAGEEVSLLKVRPGAAIPKHTHEAEELTVVFDGELHDGDAVFTKGQLAIADPSVDHH